MDYIGKLVRAGDVLHLTEYEKPVGAQGGARKRRKKQGESQGTNEELNQKKAGIRAKRKLMDLIRANVAHDWRDHEGKPCTVKFLTLTFAENVQDLERSNKEFEKFIKRLNYRITGSKRAFLKYIAVVEFQERGAVHYHVLFFNMPYVPQEELAKVWGHGFVGINAVDHVDDLGAYISKYMGKAFDDNDDGPDDPGGGGSGKRRRDKGKNRYFVSRGLIKPEEIPIKTREELERLANALAPHQVYKRKYTSEYLGTITYRQYNMNRIKK